MNKISKSENGFGAVEILLLVLILVVVGFGGYYVWYTQHKTNADKTTTNSSVNPAKSAPSKTTVSTPVAPAASDNDLITAAVKSYSGAGGSQQDATVTIDAIQGYNAEGRLKSGTTADNGFAAEFIAHKDSTGWQVVYEGQQAPGSDIGTKYGLPSGWYTTP